MGEWEQLASSLPEFLHEPDQGIALGGEYGDEFPYYPSLVTRDRFPYYPSLAAHN